MLRFIRAHPFSLMALGNIVGDFCYLGFAFDAEGLVSMPKLLGASFTMLAHIILLAYGDDQARVVADEAGRLSTLFLILRQWAQGITRALPLACQSVLRAKPVGIPFLMLSLNGLAVWMDGFHRNAQHFSLAMTDQILMGMLIILGTGLFALADFIRSQKTADLLTKLAPTVLGLASIANVILAITTRNVFMIISCFAFALSNLAGFFTHLDKSKSA